MVTISGVDYELLYWYEITNGGGIVEYPGMAQQALIGQVPAWATSWVCGTVTDQTSPSFLSTLYITSGGVNAAKITHDGNPTHHATVTAY